MQTSSVSFPGNAMIYNSIGLDFPVSLGGYEFPPADAAGHDACILHCSSAFYAPDSGLDPRTQARRGRGTLVGLSFRELERRLRDQMARGFAAGGFDPARDIEAITLNRWAHGYAYEYIRPWDTFWPAGPLPNVIARQRFGRVAIAASDSGATAYTDEAIYQAHRAIGDLAGLPALRSARSGKAHATTA
jgi:spermidine dehydrogenase